MEEVHTKGLMLILFAINAVIISLAFILLVGQIAKRVGMKQTYIYLLFAVFNLILIGLFIKYTYSFAAILRIELGMFIFFSFVSTGVIAWWVFKFTNNFLARFDRKEMERQAQREKEKKILEQKILNSEIIYTNQTTIINLILILIFVALIFVFKLFEGHL